MAIRRGVIAILVSAAAVLSTALLAQEGAQEGGRELSDAEKREFDAALEITNGIAAGQPQPNDLSLVWVREDLMKAEGNMQYVPFTVTIDPSEVNGRDVSIVWRVLPKAVEAPSETAAPSGTEEPVLPGAAFQNVTMVDLPSNKSEPVSISRSFVVPSGSYDVSVVVKEPTPERPDRNAPPLKVSVLSQALDVRDLWTGELNTSSLFLARRLEPLPAPLTPAQRAERPYVLGGLEIVPALDSRFSTDAELATYMFIYNMKADSQDKPDVTVEYSFYAKRADGEEFFNRAAPEALNAQTLPPAFSLALGHQLPTYVVVPLASFPEGDYRLEIKVTDKIAASTVTREANFTVGGS